MKQCPTCQKTYGDELFFCLDDGAQLAGAGIPVDPNAPTIGRFDVASSLRTEVLPNLRPIQSTAVISPTPLGGTASKLPYVVIALLLMTTGALAGLLVFLNLDRLGFNPRNDNVPANVAKNAATEPSPESTPSLAKSLVPTPVPTPSPVTTPNVSRFDPTGSWRGEWSTASGTLFDFDLQVLSTERNGLDGQVRWTMRRTARPDKAGKIGLSATEFVRGSYDPNTGVVTFKGYRKDDPNDVLVMLDEYKLNMSPDQRSLTGLARNGGKWNGRVSLTRMGAAAK